MKSTTEQITIATVRMTQEEFAEAGLIVGIDAQGGNTCYEDGRDLIHLYTGAAVNKVLDGDHGIMFDFTYSAIEAVLQQCGATQKEASALTDLLAEEGWGGREYEQEIPFAAIIDWFREARAGQPAGGHD